MKMARIAVGALALCFAGSLALAAEGLPRQKVPRERPKVRPDAAVAPEGLRKPMLPPGPGPVAEEQARLMQRLGFVMALLQELPDVRQEVEQHNQALRDLQEQLRQLRARTMEQLRNVRTPQEREQIIQDAKREAGAILGQIVDEHVHHNRVMADLTEQHKDEIVRKAANWLFMPRVPPRRGAAAGAPVAPGPGPEPEPDLAPPVPPGPPPAPVAPAPPEGPLPMI